MRWTMSARAVLGLLVAAAVPLVAPARGAERTSFAGRELSALSLNFLPGEVRVGQGDVLDFRFLLDLPGRVEKTLVLLAGPRLGPHVVRLSQSRLAGLAGGTATGLESEPT